MLLAQVTITADATQLAADVTQVALSSSPTAADQIGSALDTAISIGQNINPSQGTWLAIILAGLVVARIAWKKYKIEKK